MRGLLRPATRTSDLLAFIAKQELIVRVKLEVRAWVMRIQRFVLLVFVVIWHSDWEHGRPSWMCGGVCDFCLFAAWAGDKSVWKRNGHF